MNILVEPDVHDIFARIPGFGFVQTFYLQDTRYRYFNIMCANLDVYCNIPCTALEIIYPMGRH